MFNWKRKMYIGVELFFVGIISFFVISFFFYKIWEFTSISKTETIISKNISLKNYVSDGAYNTKEQLWNYLYQGSEDGQLFYISSDTELEKFINRTYCDSKIIAIENGKNFGQVTLSGYNDIQLGVLDRIWAVSCNSKFKVFDYNFTRIR